MRSCKPIWKPKQPALIFGSVSAALVDDFFLSTPEEVTDACPQSINEKRKIHPLPLINLLKETSARFTNATAEVSILQSCGRRLLKITSAPTKTHATLLASSVILAASFRAASSATSVYQFGDVASTANQHQPAGCHRSLPMPENGNTQQKNKPLVL